MYKWDILLKNLDFLGTFGHTEALPPLNVLVFFLKNRVEWNLHKNSTFPTNKYGGRGKIAGTKMGIQENQGFRQLGQPPETREELKKYWFARK